MTARRDAGAASHLDAATVLVGIDDTDNLVSKGTGRMVQDLLAAMAAMGLGRAVGATRHQLLVDPRIPYTSHNSSACIAWDAGALPDVPGIIAFAGAYLEREAALASDPGLAVVIKAALQGSGLGEAVADFGRRAKREVLNQELASVLAADAGIHLSGHGGDEGGVIGALAAVGLHLSGDDGLFLWMPGVRALAGSLTYGELRGSTPIDAAYDPAGREPEPADVIDLGTWVRPVLDGGRAVLLLAERQPGALDGTWSVAAKQVVKLH